MPPKISIILPSRMQGNDNCHLRECLDSLYRNADNADNFEVLLKFDDDDDGLDRLRNVAKEFEDKLAISYVVTPRGLGYADLHKSHNDSLRRASPSSVLYWTVSDDIEVRGRGWDNKLLKQTEGGNDLFVLNTTLTSDLDSSSPRMAIEMCDPYPVWSKRWIGLQGGFGYTFSTDGWTSLLCHRLRTHYGVDQRILVEGMGIERRIIPCDTEGSERWNGIRKETIDLMLSDQMQSLLDCTAQSFVCHLKHRGSYTGIAPELSTQALASIRARKFDGVSSVTMLKIVACRLLMRLKRAVSL